MSTTPGGPQPPFGPPGMPPANPYAPQGPPGSFAPPPAQSGSYFWLYALGGVGLFFMCCCGGCFVMPFLLTGGDRTAAFAVAESAVKNHPEVQAKLGTPIQTGFTSKSNVNVDLADGGNASFRFTVSGPKGEATINTDLRKSGDKWTATILHAEFGDGTSANLLEATPPAP